MYPIRDILLQLRNKSTNSYNIIPNRDFTHAGFIQENNESLYHPFLQNLVFCQMLNQLNGCMEVKQNHANDLSQPSQRDFSFIVQSTCKLGLVICPAQPRAMDQPFTKLTKLFVFSDISSCQQSPVRFPVQCSSWLNELIRTVLQSSNKLDQQESYSTTHSAASRNSLHKVTANLLFPEDIVNSTQQNRGRIEIFFFFFLHLNDHSTCNTTLHLTATVKFTNNLIRHGLKQKS